MPDYIASVDAGNGGTNAVLKKTKNKTYKTFYLPSVRAAATGESLGIGSQFEMDYQYVDWHEHRYVFGDDVVRVTRRRLERHMGIDRYGNEFHQFLVAVALANLGLEKGSVDLTLFAPPGQFVNLKQNIIDGFTEKDAAVNMMLSGDEELRNWNYENVTVWPEGIGAAACFILDDQGDMIETDVMHGDVVIFDLGAYTLDTLRLQDGNFNLESLVQATHEDSGVHTHIRFPLLRELQSADEDFTVLTVDDIDVAIRKGLSEDNWKVYSAGKSVDLKSPMETYRKRYAEWIANNICDGQFNGFRGVKSVVLIGGGSLLIQDYLQKWYPDKIFDPSQHETTKKIHPVYFNAIGGMRLAMMRLKQG